MTCTNTGRPGCITGSGVSHIKSNAIAGRMTLHQLEKMVEGRSNALIEPEQDLQKIKKHVKKLESVKDVKK